MFVQVIEGKVKDPDLLMRQMDRWFHEIKPGATGYLGSTGGITPDGHSITVVRFESEAAARASSERPEQTAWFNETVKAYDGEPTFHDCREVDTMFGGGSDEAGFVQIIEGRAKDAATLRTQLPQMEPVLRESRPDILGITLGWHADGKGFTQVVYFRSEDETRRLEKETADDPGRAEFMDAFDGEPTFYDLPDPRFD